ncbi:hypothetical protein RIF29_01963 [Crotalaria pallida]|uniref:Uncharacterized protein n=1 Tax=Crotalaria pallida TaxID=3830 RepID=A0AAN9IY30_CROPI
MTSFIGKSKFASNLASEDLHFYLKSSTELEVLEESSNVVLLHRRNGVVLLRLCASSPLVVVCRVAC